ncbi:MAG: S8 family serine peptidase [Acidimicrobiia bacterium]
MPGSPRALVVTALATSSVLLAAIAVPAAASSTVRAPIVGRTSVVTPAGEDRIVVKLKATVGAAREGGPVVAAIADGAPQRVVAPDTYVVDVDPSQRAALLAKLKADDRVEYADVDQPVFAADATLVDTSAAATVTPNDPQFPNQYALAKVNATTAWGTTKGSDKVVVAVLDTQVDTSHPDLASKLVPGSDFVSFTCSTGTVAASHGTVVAGIIGANTDNGVGIAGLGWNTKIMPLRVLCDNGDGRSTDVATAIRFAADNGASIVNMSLTGSPGQLLPVLADAITYAQSKGVVVVAAAGNQATSTEVYPAAYSGVLSVAATDQSDALASFSNRGSWVRIAAPGVAILSSVPGGTYSGTWSGTSFAAPYVAGAAALLAAANPGMSANGVITQLERSADRISGTGTNFVSGRLNAGAAVTTITSGYWVTSSTGDVAPFGLAGAYGALSGIALAKPVVAMVATPSGKGYWMVASDGGMFSFGDAKFFGSMGGRPLNQPIVGMAATPSGNGYWLVASDGGMFSFGDAAFFGSMGGRPLNLPIVGMSSTPTGKGYWLVASDGGIFSFGDAAFYGSTGNIKLVKPVVAMAHTPSGKGYWFTASDGGVFAYGDAQFYGSTGGITLNQPIVSMSATKTGKGYLFVASDGGVFNFGDATYLGAATNSFRTNVVAIGAL